MTPTKPTKLTAVRATKQARSFLKGRGFEGAARVGFSRTISPGHPDDPFTIRTVIYAESPTVRERLIDALQADRARMNIRQIHRLDRSDSIAHYCAIAVVREVAG